MPHEDRGREVAVTQGVVERDPVSTAKTGRLRAWLVAGAVLSFFVGAYKVGIWANHWYIAERFYYEPSVDESAKEGPYWNITQLLRSGNHELLLGFRWFGVALLCLLVATVIRRRRALRTA